MDRLKVTRARRFAWLTQRSDGQGMMEYGLILSAVAVVVVIALFAIGPKVASMFQSAGTSLSSDRQKKRNLASVNARAVLAQVAALPIRVS